MSELRSEQEVTHDAAVERAITAAVASTCNFRLAESTKWWVCKNCGTRLMVNYIGLPINERMLDHAFQHSRGW